MSDRPRIISLVPSITELLFDLGLGDQVVGRTGFCVHPAERVRSVPKVGGTKDLKFDRIRALAPTHVIVNVDENRREDAEALAEFAEVVVTHPLGPADNPPLYRRMGALFGAEAEAERLCAAFEAARTALPHPDRSPRPPQDVLYLIWREPWMTVGADTYITRTLELVGWRNRAPQSADRYPTVQLADYAGRVDRVLLSSEPFHFKAHHVDEVAALVPGARVCLIDGEMTSWYGSRAIRGMGYLAELASR